MDKTFLRVRTYVGGFQWWGMGGVWHQPGIEPGNLSSAIQKLRGISQFSRYQRYFSENERDEHTPVTSFYVPARFRVHTVKKARRVRTSGEPSNFAPPPTKVRVALFVEYFGFFWFIM